MFDQTGQTLVTSCQREVDRGAARRHLEDALRARAARRRGQSRHARGTQPLPPAAPAAFRGPRVVRDAGQGPGWCRRVAWGVVPM